MTFTTDVLHRKYVLSSVNSLEVWENHSSEQKKVTSNGEIKVDRSGVPVGPTRRFTNTPKPGDGILGAYTTAR